jgi:predicted metal-dependent peptidase
MQMAPAMEVLRLTQHEINFYINKIEKVRMNAVEKEPFLADHGFGMNLIVANNYKGTWVKTAATDGKVAIFNPTWYFNRALGLQITVFAHELFHAALGHNLRRGKRNPMLWNIACDHEVNNILVESGKYEIPDDWVCDVAYAGWSCERIYADLKKKLDDNPPPPPEKSDQPPPPGGEPVYEEENDDDEASEEEESNDEGEEGTGSDDAEDGGGDPDEEAEEQAEDDDGEGKGSGSKYGPSPEVGEVIDATNDDGSEMNAQDKKDALEELTRRTEIGKMAEIVSGTGSHVGAQVNLKKLLSTDMSWREQLGAFFTKTGTPAGETWKKLSRRGLAQRQYMPAKRYHGIEWMVFAYDVSWSMDRDALEALNQAMDDFRKSHNVARVTILPFNDIVLQSEIVEVMAEEEMPTQFNVGGGTRFSPIFSWVDRQDGTPDGIIVFTDMGDRDFGPEPTIPVLWASSEPFWSHGNSTNRPPFGDTCEIEVDSDG